MNDFYLYESRMNNLPLHLGRRIQLWWSYYDLLKFRGWPINWALRASECVVYKSCDDVKAWHLRVDGESIWRSFLKGKYVQTFIYKVRVCLENTFYSEEKIVQNNHELLKKEPKFSLIIFSSQNICHSRVSRNKFLF